MYDLRPILGQQQAAVHFEKAESGMKAVVIHAQSPDVHCPNCRVAMQLIRRIDLAEMPNIYVFYCQGCQYVETVKEEKAAA